MHCKGGNREGLPDLETHLKLFGKLLQIMAELIGDDWPLENRIIAHGYKQWLAVVEILAVLSQAFPGRCGLGVRLVLDLSVAAFVGQVEVPNVTSGETMVRDPV